MTTPAPLRACGPPPCPPAGCSQPQILSWAPWASPCQLLPPGGAPLPLSWAATIHSRSHLGTGIVAIRLDVRLSSRLLAQLIRCPVFNSPMAVHQHACEQAASRPLLAEKQC